jgi:hypothetical protein
MTVNCRDSLKTQKTSLRTTQLKGKQTPYKTRHIYQKEKVENEHRKMKEW